jgi:hypothetical protein
MDMSDKTGQARFRVLRVVGLLSLVSVLYASEARAVSISLFASVGPGSVDRFIVSRNPEDKIFEIDEDSEAGLIIAALGLVDIFGLASYRVDANFDPYFAARIAITNETDEAQSVRASLRFPMAPVLTPSPFNPPVPTFTGLFTAELVDANGDGSASYTGGGAGFALFEQVLGAALTSSHSVQLTEPGLAVVYDAAGSPIPASPRIGQWNGMEFVHLAGGQLSPQDRIEFYVFGCVALPGTSCPAPPELSLSVPVPEPSTFWLLASMFAALAGWRATRCRERLEGALSQLNAAKRV